VLTTSAAGETKAGIEQTLAAVFDPVHLTRVSPGATLERSDPAWPAEGSTLVFRVMGARLEARVSENRLPASLTLVMKTPTGENTLRHRFTALPTGGTRFEKTLEVPSGFVSRVLMTLMLERQLRSEVARTVALADELASKR
jgi:hypothetical protein